MREEDPINAAEKFYEKYGDEYYYFTTSLSKNYTGVAATVEADKTPDTAKAALYERKPEKIANLVYGGRMGNGPETSGEGFKFTSICVCG